MEPRMESVHKTYRYQLKPTPEQARALKTVLQYHHTLAKAAAKQRKTWWRCGQGKRATCYQHAT